MLKLLLLTLVNYTVLIDVRNWARQNMHEQNGVKLRSESG